MNHGEQQIVELKADSREVPEAAGLRVERIPRLDHQPRDVNHFRLVGSFNLRELGAVAEERYRGPEQRGDKGRANNEREKPSHFRQRDLMVSAERERKLERKSLTRLSFSVFSVNRYRASDSANKGWEFDWFQMPIVR